MTEAMKNLLERRSVRAYTNEAPSHDQLEQIMQAAVYAPSAMGQQSWHFLVIESPTAMQKVEALLAKALGRPDYHFYGAPAIILAAGPRDNRNAMADCAVALENIFLAAHSLGLGTCWINQFRDAWDDRELAAELTRLGLPEGYVVYGASIVGHPVSVGQPKPRRQGLVTYVK